MIGTLAVPEWTLKTSCKHLGTAGQCSWALASNINSFFASGDMLPADNLCKQFGPRLFLIKALAIQNIV